MSDTACSGMMMYPVNFASGVVVLDTYKQFDFKREYAAVFHDVKKEPNEYEVIIDLTHKKREAVQDVGEANRKYFRLPLADFLYRRNN